MTDENVRYRIEYINAINQRIFQLIYYGKFSYMDCEGMTSQELNWFYQELIHTKEEENKAREEALKH